MKRLRMGQEQKAPRGIRLLRDRPWLIVAGCVAVLAAAGLFLVLTLPRGDTDTLLRAIDAAHVVPEEENAAGIYTELAWDPDVLFPGRSLLLQKVSPATLAQLGRHVGFPGTGQKIDANQMVLDVLSEAAHKPQCWFSVFEARWQAGKRTDAGGQWALVLVQAADRDLAAGRTDAGLEKLLCVFRMARHFLAQGSPSDYKLGTGMAWCGLRRFYTLVVLEDAPPQWLAKLEDALPPTEDIPKEQARLLDKVRALYEQEYPLTLRARLKNVFSPRASSRGTVESDLIYLGRCRAARILLALRRYKNETGAWPADLRELGARVPTEALLDPLCGKPFAYRLRGDSFLLYSLSVNGTDEGGKMPDDFPFWP